MKIGTEELVFITLVFLSLLIYIEFRDLENKIKKLSNKLDRILERD